jgi:hypothetical protein
MEVFVFQWPLRGFLEIVCSARTLENIETRWIGRNRDTARALF